jgi:AbrB family looped-hinge helix DNA binding protein
MVNTIMATVEIDKAGRIVVPKHLRDALHLTPGTKLTVERAGDTLVLEPSFPQARLVIENGFPVIYPAEGFEDFVLTNEMVSDIIQQGRHERERRILGLEDDSVQDRESA